MNGTSVFMRIFRETLLNNAQVTNVPTSPLDVVNKQYVDSLPYVTGPATTIVGKVPTYANTTGNQLTSTPVSIDALGNTSGINTLTVNSQAEFGTIYMGTGKFITLVDLPTQPQYAANKLYVDTQIASSMVAKQGPSQAQSIVRWVGTGGLIEQSPQPATLSDTGVLSCQNVDLVVSARLGGVDYLAFGGGTAVVPNNLLLGPTQYNGGILATNNLLIGTKVGSQPVGTPAMNAATQNNVFVGNGVLSDPFSTAQVGAFNNVVIGQQTGAFIKTLQNCVMVGYQAGEAAVACQNCVFVGAGAGLTSTGGGSTGTECVFVGALAGADNTFGRDNVCLGYNTLTNNHINTVVMGSNAIALADNSVTIAPTITTMWSAGLATQTVLTASDALTYNPATGQIGHDNRYYVVNGPNFIIDSSIGNIQVPSLAVGSGASLVYNTVSKNIGYVASSRRYKNSITAMDCRMSARIYDLEPRQFAWNTTGEADYGLIAEETLDVCPDLVVMNERGEPETVAYNKLPVLLLAEVQHLNERNKGLEHKVDQLERLIETQAGILKKLVEKLSRVASLM